MKKKGFKIKLIIVIFSICIIGLGCELQEEEIPLEQLPPIPNECYGISKRHSDALYGAYTLLEVSQLQLARITNEFFECLKNEGLSEPEAKGIIKNKEEIAKGDRRDW